MKVSLSHFVGVQYAARSWPGIEQILPGYRVVYIHIVVPVGLGGVLHGNLQNEVSVSSWVVKDDKPDLGIRRVSQLQRHLDGSTVYGRLNREN